MMKCYNATMFTLLTHYTLIHYKTFTHSKFAHSLIQNLLIITRKVVFFCEKFKCKCNPSTFNLYLKENNLINFRFLNF